MATALDTTGKAIGENQDWKQKGRAGERAVYRTPAEPVQYLGGVHGGPWPI